MPDPTVPLTADDLRERLAAALTDIVDTNDAMGEVLAEARAEVKRLTPPQGWFVDLDGHGTRALWSDHPDGPADPWPRMLAAEHPGQSALWDWLGTVIPTRTEGDTTDA